MDTVLRKLWRNGEFERYWHHIGKADLFFSYKESVNHNSILETKCSFEDCSGVLEWSNCCYCISHSMKPNTCRMATLELLVSKYIVATSLPGLNTLTTRNNVSECKCSTAGLTFQQIELITKYGLSKEQAESIVPRGV